jgi:polysaccharide deacetylase family protein (PEP-CTERM system associated)
MITGSAACCDPQNAFTVDVEEWFHVCGDVVRDEQWDALPSRIELTMHRLLDILDGSGVRATFFFLGWIAQRYPRLVQAVTEGGHDIGAHGHSHRRAYDLGREAFTADVRASVDALKDAGAPDVRQFRAPEWSVNDKSLWALETLAEEGFALDASMAPVRIVGSVLYPRHPHLRRTSAGPIVEVPPLVADRFGQVMPLGWGWGLRMSTPRLVLRTIDDLNVRGLPAVLMVHPWEIDPEPPRLRLPARLRFAHYFRLGGFAQRLSEILRHGQFGPIDRIVPVGAPVERSRAQRWGQI